MPLADVLLVTHVHTTIADADRFFPLIDPAAWRETAREAHPADACKKVDEGEGGLLRTLVFFKKGKKGFRSDCVDGFSCSCRICGKLFSDVVTYIKMDLFCHALTFWDRFCIVFVPIIGYVHKKCK